MEHMASSVGQGNVTGVTSEHAKVVVCGSYRRDRKGLLSVYRELEEMRCEILSPASLDFCAEKDGFVLLPQELEEEPQQIEERHLEAIQQADFVWLHAPDGYIGPSGALEIGFANAAGVPMFSAFRPADITVAKFVTVVDSSRTAMLMARTASTEPRRPTLLPFQRYYEKVAKQRGYDREGIKECLLLLVEEVGELARAIRKGEGLVRHNGYRDENEAQELADIFLYTVHIANVLKIDLSHHVEEKEKTNRNRFLVEQRRLTDDP